MALIKKGDTYFVRYTIPTAQRELLGRTQVWRTTKCKDKREAKQRQHRILADIIREIDDELAGATPPEPKLVAKDLLAQVASGEMNTDDARIILEDFLERSSAPERQLSSAARMVSSAGSFMPLDDAIEDYRKTRKGNINDTTLTRVENVLKAFSEWHGDGGVDSVTRRVAGEYIADVIVPAGTSYKTKVWHVSALRSAWRYFTARDWTGDMNGLNPWDGHLENYRPSKRGTSDTTERRIYSDDELKSILESMDTDDPMFQVWIVCLHHGCRAEEVASLKVSSVNLEERSFGIVEGKNQSSVRTLPMHKDTIHLFESLANGKKPDALLFDGVKPDSKGQHSGLLSKRGGRWLRSHVSEDKSLVFYHSLRHTLTTALEAAGVEPHLIKRIGGWSFQDETFGTYSKGPGLDRMREALDSVSFGF